MKYHLQVQAQVQVQVQVRRNWTRYSCTPSKRLSISRFHCPWGVRLPPLQSAETRLFLANYGFWTSSTHILAGARIQTVNRFSESRCGNLSIISHTNAFTNLQSASTDRLTATAECACAYRKISCKRFEFSNSRSCGRNLTSSVARERRPRFESLKLTVKIALKGQLLSVSVA